MTVYIWNKDKTTTINQARIRQISITWIQPYTFEVRAWFNNRAATSLGTFETYEKARDFIQDMQLHKRRRSIFERLLNIGPPRQPRRGYYKLVWE